MNNDHTRTYRCEYCKEDFERGKFFPFCSERCQLIDLGEWASESYRIKGPAAVEESLNQELLNKEQHD